MNPEKDNFGVPKVDYSPMGTVGMEGNFFRGLTNKTPRSLFVRVCIIVFATVFFLLPALLFIFIIVLNYSEFVRDTNWMGIVLAIFLILLYLGAWIAIVKANIKR
jgi:glucan phosphoethanolaminetransferase (alkaline phosphatase superfamily)